MNKHQYWAFGVLALIFACLSPAECLSQTPSGRLPLKVLPGVRLTVLVDNMSGFGPVLGEWGVAFALETGEHQILFDTGAGGVLLGNARALHLDWRKTEAVVISHEHQDHTGGLADVLRLCAPLDLFVHPAGFETRYWKEDNRIEPHRLPLSREELRQRVRKLVETRGPSEVPGGFMVTGQIPRLTDFEDTGVREYAFLDEKATISDPILDDQALFFKVPEGVVILLGCGHAGLVNTMRYVSQLAGGQKIYAIVGGTHLMSASPERMRETVEAIRKYDVQKLMFSHCTGVQAFGELRSAFPGRCSWPASGAVIQFGNR